ncbi:MULTISPECIES: DUF2815 family protein [Corynebacterium]|uniref:DUF2815 domain-containing protein n=1 Tax=Corynebacterium rouxii TaxID=2719119 RepID=A0A6I8MBM2_9CORY|nr:MULTISPECIES: DUF2815 family protein [Corynebacterium]OWO24041.1 hypothetical protein AY535_08565 [Corynebacterium diphtheriae bv. gravis]CAB0518986.1 hypothetical protein CIP101280_01735 [Corynebacterium diphtheriae]CAB0525379.1 hypothetical protein CIP101434_02045 [Corynebacterium diphtheriae]VZH85329.1 hypothetical protein FRC0190_01295 [Corynebacterium rouxii]
MSNAKLMSARRVRTGEVRFSYVHVDTPRVNKDSGKESYSMSILIPKTDTETLSLIEQAVENALQEGIGKFGGKIPPRGALKLPLRDGDTEREDPVYEGHYFINANANVDRQPQLLKLSGGKAVPAQEGDVYSGAYGLVTIELFAYSTNGNKGVGAGLGNILKLRDGEALSGGATAEDDFGDIAPTAASEFGAGSTGGFGSSSFLD